MSFGSDNYLILTDPVLREKAGVSILDSDLDEVYEFQKQHQQGGAASGVPHHIDKYGHHRAINLHHKHVQQRLDELKLEGQQVPPEQQNWKQSGGGYPYHYYTNNKKW